MRVWRLGTVCLLISAVISPAADLSRVWYFANRNEWQPAKHALAQAYLQAATRQEQEELTFIAGQLFTKEKNYDKAIETYRALLIKNPSLTRVRLELGYVYFLTKQDEAACYQLRLVLSDKTLSPALRRQIFALLDAIRRRKAWSLQVRLGLSPDTNINNVSGRRISCVNFMGTPVCRELDAAESDIGFQGMAALGYIYKFSDTWGLKTQLVADAVDYRDKQYSFWGIGGSIGPRYVAAHSEYGLGVLYHQQYNEERRYYAQQGLYGEMAADVSARAALSVRAGASKLTYHQVVYHPYDADLYTAQVRLSYSLNSRSFMALTGGWGYEDSAAGWNRSVRQTYGVGYGRELPWGFVVYVEPNVSVSHYRHARYFLNSYGGFDYCKRHDTTYGVYVSLRNKLLQFYNLEPTVNFIYHKRTSNVFNYDYERSRWEIGISRSF